MSSSRSKGTTPGLPNQFKPAVVLSAMPMTEFSSTYYLTLQKETYTSSGTPMVHLTDDPDLSDGNPVTSMITRFPLLTPTLREVTVFGKKHMQAGLIEFDPGGYGIGVIMTQVVEGEIYVNVRFMPFAPLTDIVTPDKDGTLIAYLPNTDIAKLNVTLKPSAAGEPIYRTHKVEVLFSNATEAQVSEITSQLELFSAGVIAHVTKDMLSTVAHWPPADLAAVKETMRCSPFARQTVSTVLLGCSLVCVVVVGGLAIAYNTASKDNQAGLLIGGEIAGFSAAVLGAVGGLVANYINGVEARDPTVRVAPEPV